MPQSLDPSSRLTMVLASDAGKPHDEQPRIFARTLTLSQHRRLMAAMRRMKESPDDAIDAALDAAEVCLTGWENMIDPATQSAIPFNRESIGDILSIDELSEIFDFVVSTTAATPDIKKKSG